MRTTDLVAKVGPCLGVLIGVVLLAACPQRRYAPLLPTAQVPAPPQATGGAAINPKLMIFGGTNHTVYLGCLNCSEYAADSVKNVYGTYGSPYSQDSIFNRFGPYGSPYSAGSACSEYATDPPVIVDQAGRYYGRLTLNHYATDIGIGVRLFGWLAAACHGS